MLDSLKHKGLRRNLIKLLEQKGIKNVDVLEAMLKIPRHWFLDSAISEHAYQDKALAIGMGQTISQPYTVAYQTELLQVSPGLKVLEVGTGSGYQGSVLCELGTNLFSIERIKELTIKAEKLFIKLGYNPRLKIGDGSLGWPAEAPFDRIIVTAAAPDLGKALFAQLKPGGILIIPVGDKVQTMYKVEKLLDGTAKTTKYANFRFVPLIGEKGFNK